MQNGYAKQAASRQNTDGATGHGVSIPIPAFWVSDSFMNLWAVLTELQPFTGKKPSNESEKSSEEARAYERARQQNAREEASRWKGKGKAKNILLANSTPSSSELPARQPTSSFPPSSTTTNKDAAHARTLQAQIDSERASYELARQLQAQEEAVHQEHQRLVQEAARVKLFDCAVCIEKYPEDYSAPIRSCGHVLCRECMKEHVKSQVNQALWPVRCPMCVADHSRTEDHGGEHGPAPLNSVEHSLIIVLLVITRDLIETLGIDEAVLGKWIKLEMDKVSVAVECPR